ncbi:hypothetical protein [Nocardia niigatensis]|uniref:hypothetical protein n=1 Tax=Nocardia niigatensis TaxID=209249 RepID=UPI0002D804E4|nr:hypothetical protein [Nocardia niigatensis]
MSVYGVNPPPCVIVLGAEAENDQVTPIVSKYAKTIRGGLDPQPRWLSWDAVVAIGYPHLPLDTALRVVQVGGGQAAGAYVQRSSTRTMYHYPRRYIEPGHELVIPANLSDARRDLVKRHLIPALPDAPSNRSVFHRPPGADDDNWVPILENADGNAIAVIYRPHAGASEVWYLPEEAIDILDPALHLAFGEWNSQDPKRFPSSPKWTSDVRWMSAHQQKQIEAVRAEIEEAREQVVLLTASIEFGEVKLDELMRDAEQSPQRRLLTDNDDSLVEAVMYALRKFGFVVVDLDKQLSEGEPRMGDLSVSDEDWTAIAEVKGYTKGAKSNDLLTVGRHRRVYEKKHGDVQRMWYVANPFRLDSPDGRPKILDGADEHIADFAHDDGSVIDTRDLFDLLKRVDTGDLTPESAREALKEAKGRLQLD